MVAVKAKRMAAVMRVAVAEAAAMMVMMSSKHVRFRSISLYRIYRYIGTA